MTKLPVTLLTGFLGSGKSTLLSRILKEEQFSDSAVIINEFGEIGLDDFLVVHSEEQIVEMTTGCLCCTVRGDITETLLSLWEKREEGSLKPFSRIIIETTGMADPAPVIHTLVTDPRLSKRFNLNGVITTLDSLNGLFNLESYEESAKQVALADQIVLTKTDLGVDEAIIDDLKTQCKQINPNAPISISKSDDFDLGNLFEKTDNTHNLDQWIGQSDDHDHHHGHDHHHHHSSNIHSFSVIIDEPVSQQAFTLAMQLLIGNHGENLLRIKAIINLQDSPNEPLVLQGVQHVFHEPVKLDTWPSEDRRTRMVFITRNIPDETIKAYFKAWFASENVEMIESHSHA